MSEKNYQKLLKELKQLKEENHALKLLYSEKAADNETLSEKLHPLEWMSTQKQTATTEYVTDYGDLSSLNKNGLIKKYIEKDQLHDIISEYLDVLETSAAIYEKNGDYAMGIFSSGWCRMMDSASRKLCHTKDNRKALASGKWLCHESCWKEASLRSMNEGKPVEVACNGGINLYAVPVYATKQIIGVINFGFGSPPKDDEELKKLSKKFKIPIEELRKQSTAYNDRPRFIIDYAKKRIHNSAKYLGFLVERNMAEEAVRQSEEKLKSIFRVAPTGIGVVKNRIFTEVNPKVCEMTGYSSEELVGKNAIILYPTKEEYEFVGREKYKQITQSGTGSVETLWQRKDGKIINVLLCSTPVDSDDLSKGVIFTALDINERKEAQIKLAESEARYRNILESAPVGIAIHQNDKIVFVNPEGVKMLGADSGEQIIGKEIADIIHPDNLDKLRKRKQRMINGEQGLYPAEDKYIRMDGKVIDVEVMATSLTYKNKPAVQVIITDITERKKILKELIAAKEKAEESDRLKSAFLANMSHEIRTPMNGILGFTQLLLEPDLNSKEKENYIKMVQQSGQRMLNTVSDIIEISKIEAGMVKVNLKKTDFNYSIEELIHFFQPEAKKKGLKLIVNKLLPVTAKTIITDQNKLDSILTNLIKNAIKYTHSGSIQVGCRKKGHFIEFYINDTGIGIPKNRQEAIFDRFIMADIDNSRALEGSGLGLAIAKSHVEMLGGKMWVDSEEGKGSTFFFSLPYNKQDLLK